MLHISLLMGYDIEDIQIFGIDMPFNSSSEQIFALNDVIHVRTLRHVMMTLCVQCRPKLIPQEQG